MSIPLATRGPPAPWVCRPIARPRQGRAWLRASRHSNPRASAAEQAAAPTETQLAFQELLEQAGASSTVRLEPSQHGNGLFLERGAAKGQVVLSVPTAVCLVVDYPKGMQMPPAEWPRLRRGVQKDDAMPWDLLQALALLDGLSGAGGDFWARYTNALLPEPTQLAMPACLPDPPLLGELQHGAIIEGARAQKERLRGLFPGLSQPMCEGGPTWFEWAFSCVRSRAFRLGADAFALVPLMDGANHAGDPSCDFRLAEGGQAVELVAVRDCQVGEEATVSYTGPQGMTNQRLMAQYGFVPPHGNTADRLEFAALASPAPDGQTSGSGGQGSAGGQPVLLSLDRLQACLGDGQAMAAAFSGRDPYLYAALKSLPLAIEEGKAASWQAQADLAKALLAELEEERAGWATSPSEDQQLLQGGAATSDASGGGSSAGSGAGALDLRLEAAVQYRLQRKLLVGAGEALLRRFLDS